jgi:hypothetical protein
MDATASEKQEVQDASMASVLEVRRAPLPELAGASGAAEESGVAGEDEQVERFYALLANIRALRNVYGAVGPSRKRARVADPPWRPEFRMEDFREADDVAPVKKERRVDCVERHRRRPENEDDAAGHDGEVVEENDRVSASQSTRSCTDSD